jgi:hypothetical protein
MHVNTENCYNEVRGRRQYLEGNLSHSEFDNHKSHTKFFNPLNIEEKKEETKEERKKEKEDLRYADG